MSKPYTKYEGGYMHDCFLIWREGDDPCFFSRRKADVVSDEVLTAHLIGYTIIPNERFAKMESDKAKLVEALRAVVRVADRSTDEFDLAHDALESAERPW